MRILRSLVKEAREPAEIAAEFDLSASEVFAHLENLLRRGYAEERPAGCYCLSLPGKIAASSAASLDFETICQRLGEPKWIPKGISIGLSADETISGRAIEFKCGCAAFRIDPPSDDPGMRFMPCSDERGILVHQKRGFE